MPREIAIAPVLVTQGSGPIELKVKGKGMWPYHVVIMNGKKLATRFVSKNEIDATIRRGDRRGRHLSGDGEKSG